MARRVSFHAAVLAATLVLVSCGGGSDQGGGTDSSPTASPSSSSSGNGGGGNGGNGAGEDGFGYVPWGPDDPPIPGQYAAFAASSRQDLRCESVDSEAPAGEFWDVAAAVCRAVRGDDSAWPDRTTVPGPPDPGNAIQDCLDGELAAMLHRALDWHANNPGRRPKIAYPSGSAMSSCRYKIYGVRLLTGDAAASSGHEGRIAVEIAVPAGPAEFAVTVDGQQVDSGDVDQNGEQDDGLEQLAVFLEPPQQRRTVKIGVSNGRGTGTADVDLPGAGDAGSPSPADSPTPPDQTGGQTSPAAETASGSASPDG